MKSSVLIGTLFLTSFTFAQTGRVVLIEEFVETACSACAQYDSAFHVITDINADKVAVINFHCHYRLDPFYTFNKACDERYKEYELSGFPCAMMNGKKPISSSAHISYVNQSRIDAQYNQQPLFKFDIKTTSTSEGEAHSADIEVTAQTLVDNLSKDLSLYVVVTESNINYEDRYGSKSVNGINEFHHIMRAMLPGPSGTLIGSQAKGNVSQVNVSFTNDDEEINYEEVRVVAFIQDRGTKEVLGAAVTKEHPFK